MKPLLDQAALKANPTEQIRVVNVLARLNIGGPAIYVSLVTQHLGHAYRPDYSSELIVGRVGSAEGDMGYYAIERGVRPIILPTLGRELHPLRDIRTVWLLYRIFRRLRPDIVSTHTAKAGVVGRIAAKLAAVPVIVHTFHGHVFHGYFSQRKTRIFQWIERWCARFTNAIIVLTQSQRDEIVGRYRIAPETKVRVIPGGLDLTTFLGAARMTGTFRRRLDISADARLVTIVGRLVPVKNHALFLEAAARVRATNPSVCFAIVGDGELRSQLADRVEALGLREFVSFAGWQQDVAAVYADSDVLTVTSLNEGTPFSVIEALATGTPVVATAVGGLPDLLEFGRLGTLVPSGDVDALATAILNAVDRPPHGADFRMSIAAKYDIHRLTVELDTLYRSLLNGCTGEQRAPTA